MESERPRLKKASVDAEEHFWCYTAISSGTKKDKKWAPLQKSLLAGVGTGHDDCPHVPFPGGTYFYVDVTPSVQCILQHWGDHY
jgi:hypothetical protein